MSRIQNTELCAESIVEKYSKGYVVFVLPIWGVVGFFSDTLVPFISQQDHSS
jgi:hypothetical protein